MPHTVPSPPTDGADPQATPGCRGHPESLAGDLGVGKRSELVGEVDDSVLICQVLPVPGPELRALQASSIIPLQQASGVSTMGKKGSSERLPNLPKITQLTGSRAGR